MALKNSPQIQSESREKERRNKTKMRSSKCKAEISCSVLSPDSNAIQIGGEEDTLGAEKKRHRKFVKRKRPISMLEIEGANTALKKLQAEVKEKKEEASLMKNKLAETEAMVEEIESLLNQLKGGVYAMKNWIQIT